MKQRRAMHPASFRLCRWGTSPFFFLLPPPFASGDRRRMAGVFSELRKSARSKEQNGVFLLPLFFSLSAAIQSRRWPKAKGPSANKRILGFCRCRDYQQVRIPSLVYLFSLLSSAVLTKLLSACSRGVAAADALLIIRGIAAVFRPRQGSFSSSFSSLSFFLFS